MSLRTLTRVFYSGLLVSRRQQPIIGGVNMRRYALFLTFVSSRDLVHSEVLAARAYASDKDIAEAFTEAILLGVPKQLNGIVAKHRIVHAHKGIFDFDMDQQVGGM